MVVGLVLGLVVGGVTVWILARSKMGALRAEVEHERSRAADHEALASRFDDVAAKALRDNTASFLELAKTQLEPREKAVGEMIQPIKESLEKVGETLRGIEVKREGAYSAIETQVKLLVESQKELRTETGNLVTALRSPVVRGRWGEMQLRRVVEMAGMLAHCDFVEQTTVTADGNRLRPDLLVNLPGGKQVVVDAKAPLQAYLDALEARDDDMRRAKLADHARQIRDHIAKLSAKSYWSQFERTPEFVVLFIPGETFFSAALEHDPTLIEQGVNQQVILATPTTLIALLRAVAYGWNQETVAESARQVSELGRELYNRIATFAGHVSKVGRGLESAVRAYNDSVGSFERSVVPGARKLKDHGVTPSSEIAELREIELTPRAPKAPELPAAVIDDAA